MYHFNPKSPYKSNSFRNPLTSRIQSFKWSLGQKIKIPGLNIQENTQKNPGILLGSINIVMMIYSLNPILQKRWKEMNMYWIQEWINKAKFVSVSIFFIPPFSCLSGYYWVYSSSQEEERKKQILTQKPIFSSKYMFFFHPHGYSVATQAWKQRNEKKLTYLKKFGFSKNID